MEAVGKKEADPPRSQSRPGTRIDQAEKLRVLNTFLLEWDGYK